RRHTRSKRDWSSDVCSSDLARIEPHHVLDFAPPNPPALKKFRPPENRMLVPELNKLPGKFEERLLLFVPLLPIEPADFIVLAIRSEERRVGKGCRPRRSRCP